MTVIGIPTFLRTDDFVDFALLTDNTSVRAFLC